jgi:hypothetical protein
VLVPGLLLSGFLVAVPIVDEVVVELALVAELGCIPAPDD